MVSTLGGDDASALPWSADSTRTVLSWPLVSLHSASENAHVDRMFGATHRSRLINVSGLINGAEIGRVKVEVEVIASETEPSTRLTMTRRPPVIPDRTRQGELCSLGVLMILADALDRRTCVNYAHLLF
jgi:hypothetical protein